MVGFYIVRRTTITIGSRLTLHACQVSCDRRAARAWVVLVRRTVLGEPARRAPRACRCWAASDRAGGAAGAAVAVAGPALAPAAPEQRRRPVIARAASAGTPCPTGGRSYQAPSWWETATSRRRSESYSRAHLAVWHLLSAGRCRHPCKSVARSHSNDALRICSHGLPVGAACSRRRLLPCAGAAEQTGAGAAAGAAVRTCHH